MSNFPIPPSVPPDLLKGDNLEILVNKGLPFYEGEIFADWERLKIRRSIFSAAGSFQIQTAHHRPWPMRPEVEVTISLAGEEILHGFVDTLKSTVDQGKKMLAFAGRDATAVLVDCSAINDPGEWRGLTVRQIIEQICEPFKIEVVADATFKALDTETLEVFKLQPGERAWTAIDRALRLRGYLAHATGSGALRIARAGSSMANAEIVEGANLVKSEISWGHLDRFSKYIVRGQAAGADNGFGSAVQQPEGVAFDAQVDRFRPTIILAEGQVSQDAAQRRAEWEASFRAARAAPLKVRLQGWGKGLEGSLGSQGDEIWKVNELVPVKIPNQGLEKTLLVEDIVFARDNGGGSTADLTLVRPDAYTPKPFVDAEAEPFSDILGELDE